MKRDPIKVKLHASLEASLDKVFRQAGRTRSEVLREVSKRHLTLLRFEQLRRRTMPFAKARGYLTDEDVFNGVS